MTNCIYTTHFIFPVMQVTGRQSALPQRQTFADAYSKASNAISDQKEQRNGFGITVSTPYAIINSGFSQEASLPPEYKDLYYEVLAIDGRKEAAMEVLISQIRATQYFDFGNVYGKLTALKDIADNADYSGMSAAEKARIIYARWDHTFGDFRKIYAEGYLGYPGRQTDAERILLQFNNELRSVFGSTENARAAYRVAEYGNKSSADIRTEITAKYPPMSEITLREFHFMVYEMYQVASDDGLWKVLNRSNCPSMGVTAGVKEALFDKPFNESWLFHTYNTMQNAACKSVFNDVGNSGIVLHELFGARFDERGNIYTDQHAFLDFKALIEQLIESFKNMSVSDFEDWILELYTKNGVSQTKRVFSYPCNS